MNDDDSNYFKLPHRYVIEGTLPGQGVDTNKFIPKLNKNNQRRIYYY
jgi:hypothetical protein